MVHEQFYSATTKQLLEFDKKHIWHPYTSLNNPLTVLPVKRANKCTIYVDNVEESSLIDGMSSWWSVIHGYNNDELNTAITDQLKQVSHVMFGGFTHSPAVELTQRLLQLIDHEKLAHCFFADSGSVAVEVAMKMALQYSASTHPQADISKHKFLTVRNGYHGDTIGAMSVCDPINSIHSIFNGYLRCNIYVDAPPSISILPSSPLSQHVFNTSNDIVDTKPYMAMFEKHLQNYGNEIVAVIIEPIVQGAGGMRFWHPRYLIDIRKLCNKYEKLLILDEIATGFGRTGQIFAFKHCKLYQEQLGIPAKEQTDVYPDIMCVGKALTGGYMTLSAVVVSKEVGKGLSSPSSPTKGVLMHGPTFMGNPLACSVANKSLEIIMRNEWQSQVRNIEQQLFEELFVPIRTNKQWMGHMVKRVAVLGAIGVVELHMAVDQEWFQHQFVDRGINIRPFGKLVYIMPPYIITSKELTILTRAIIDVLTLWEKHIGSI
ncbi:similar to Saccharomyces cerevisiae YNR058W BIO3 7,8-diamino-pelargonic acid aminotransferase (DAPA), catalyzes the second step in the biotin biosynthesis pathway [Maudiozyma barnettii]|uniref:Similar to Saccharomyces cerevisiae YNR058W BIO3 7,8-diamino-pelargonic acid aminotransferase (DAPA), catalyzes the second step in the biotin biosynthesis pathway n=1 Tax=Maudiozyma barnettii TaxID=61262 RepID=A0A8H2VEU1_9SACH|nr:adenosylmethionine-8-amino-7-oxononanoate transaminase [Kazachstania barnettii]CAB4254170.1 similar to Saccharomyces cerevisiae YNR058W BIO3 7,8-diamino-pelargonic acid aminotransferase (DAPA), catalyzes the second step in the biotin biosynthesis pathway [Kazachstania barnettii]CAD1785588.1 similar to Saccharomyces cerevisiae YNR058W BIO3 7,8-diamino-pelargonic acid aminotransferase (DAPA), catalyzes the second step in the biotin biosynthesis pathway [Kazachstania barnettii]